jgi:heptosyltransferase-1
MDKVLIVRLSAMGDVIHALPAAAAIRQALPQVEIGWVIEERWSELLCAKGYSREGTLEEERPLVSRVHLVRTKEWRRNLLAPRSWSATWKDLQSCFREMRETHYDVALDLQGAIRSAVIARGSGAKKVIGSAEPRERPARLFYQEKLMPIGTHVIEQGLSLVQRALIQRVVIQKQIENNTPIFETPDAILPRDPAAEAWCDRYCAEQKVRKLVLFNPGAGWGAKQWPADRYADVARELAADGYTPLVNYGPGEKSLAESVASWSGGAARHVQCSLGELIALTRRAQLFIGGDTGPLHLAAALRIPVVAVFGPTDPARNGPFGTRSVVLRNPESATSHKRRGETEPGMFHITKDQVLAAARDLLAGVSA